ncbi:MAG: ATP-binding protein [Oleispira sp.]
MKNNLFWLLFGSTALGLSICGLALYFSILFAMEQDQVLDFADDVQILRTEIEENCAPAKQVFELKNCIAQHDGLFNFIIQLSQTKPRLDRENLNRKALNKEALEAEEIGLVGDKRIYDYFDHDNQEEGFLATMPLRVKGINKDFWLIIRDDLNQDAQPHSLNAEENDSVEESEYAEEDEDGLDIALTGAMYGIFILLFILALFLYIPVRKLNRWIGDMQYASEEIAKQNYDVRLTEYKTQPLGNLASSFNSMAESIQGHIRDKNILANAIAHELRTPLTRFRLALGLLNRQPLAGLAKELVSDLERYTDDLEMITDNTLRLATLRDSKINLLTINLDEFINNQGEKFNASFPELTLSVSNQACQLQTDVGFLQLALDNLLSNACHYAESNVSLRQWKDEGHVYIEVCDDGPGIPEKDVEYIQQAFTRLDKSRNRATGGTGLGLAIVRIAVQRLAGELKFQPAAKGTRILLSLPIKND